MTRRAFTVVELLLALALATVVSLAAFGLLVTVYRAESMGQSRFAAEAEMQTLQRSVRALSRSVTSLSKPQQGLGGFVGPEPGDAEIEAAESRLREQMDRSGQPYTPESLRSQAIEEARRTARENAQNQAGLDPRERIPPRFELRLEATGSGGALPVLEALLTDPPVPPRWSADPEERRAALAGNLVRGVVEGVRSADFEKDGWTLHWRAIEPPAEPVTLARRVAGWEWSVMRRKFHAGENDPFAETWSAWYDEDFPRALRLQVAMMDGARGDWLFDIPRPIIPVTDADDTPSTGADDEGGGTVDPDPALRSPGPGRDVRGEAGTDSGRTRP